MTLVEVMIAILIFLIIMVGGMNFFTLPRSILSREGARRLALAAASSRLESLLALDYLSLDAGLNESATKLKLAGFEATRKTTVSAMDDPKDGKGLLDTDGNPVDYKKVTVEIHWFDGLNQQVVLTTYVSEFGK